MVALLDVNVLIALAWPTHVHHAAARQWFADHADDGWVTCSITESGFVRVSANEQAVGSAVSPGEAVEMLRRLEQIGDHNFLIDDVSLVHDGAVPIDRIQGHRQVTDAHLVDLATRNGYELVTLDSRIEALADETATVHTIDL